MIRQHLCAHLIKQLQHDGKNIRVSLIHLIKQDNSVGGRSQQLRQLTPFFMSNVSWGGADELCYLRDEKMQAGSKIKSQNRCVLLDCTETGFTVNTLWYRLHQKNYPNYLQVSKTSTSSPC